MPRWLKEEHFKLSNSQRKQNPKPPVPGYDPSKFQNNWINDQEKSGLYFGQIIILSTDTTKQ